MRESFKGREVLEWAENYLDVKCNIFFDDWTILNILIIAYVIAQKDVGKMARAYVNDIVLFLDVANKENKRILDKHDLI